jgi:hypothetical protein
VYGKNENESDFSTFIEEQVNNFGEVVIVLGARSSESAARASNKET